MNKEHKKYIDSYLNYIKESTIKVSELKKNFKENTGYLNIKENKIQ